MANILPMRYFSDYEEEWFLNPRSDEPEPPWHERPPGATHVYLTEHNFWVWWKVDQQAKKSWRWNDSQEEWIPLTSYIGDISIFCKAIEVPEQTLAMEEEKRMPPHSDKWPPYATHAFWKKDHWIYWQVAEEVEDSWYWTGHKWLEHMNYIGHGKQFAKAVSRQEAERFHKQQPETNAKRRKSMNLHNAALLVIDDIRTCKVHYTDGDNGRRYTYVIPPEMDVQEDDLVIVPTMYGVKLATVYMIDVEPEIDVEADFELKPILGTLRSLEPVTEGFRRQWETIKERLEERKQRSARDQILAALGITDEREIKALRDLGKEEPESTDSDE